MTDVADWDDRLPYDDSPEPPEHPPLNLKHVEAGAEKALAWLFKNKLGECPEVEETVRAMGEVLERLRSAEMEIDRWESLPVETIRCVVVPEGADIDDPDQVLRVVTESTAIRSAQNRGGIAYAQEATLRPLVQIWPPVKPPF
ncbi:hypothetical protein [Streptosporangium sp. NPDC051022]|uniref:hypothetical protein n=1 Tax=Streptosporangium sp. NPDC051022 TaxID=3155752 RepID=UPI00341A9552